jgi:uncharacterized protein (DUF697 family)
MAKWASALKRALPSRRREQHAREAGDAEAAALPDDDAILDGARALAPVVWMLGKVQSGKTSIIRGITRAPDAAIGDGFRPCTRTSRIYEFPNDAPVLRFLDTRGLGEAGYDAAEDLAFAEGHAHLVLVTMRAMDPQQQAVVDLVKLVRKRHPDWPVVVAQTTLHDGYATGMDHVLPYPFRGNEPLGHIPGLPDDLIRGLAFQRTLFEGMKGATPAQFVPIDLTHPDDGLHPADYGLDALTEALSAVAPASLLTALSAMPGFSADPRERSADPLIMGHAMAAAGGDLVPIPVAGTIAATTVQARLLHKLGELYGIKWDKRAYADLSAAIGAGTLLKIASQIGLRQLVKMIPAYGQTAGAAASAAASFALTYALGKAAVYYLHRRRLGSVDRKGVALVYQQSLRDAFRIAKERRLSDSGGAAPA